MSADDIFEATDTSNQNDFIPNTGMNATAVLQQIQDILVWPRIIPILSDTFLTVSFQSYTGSDYAGEQETDLQTVSGICHEFWWKAAYRVPGALPCIAYTL